MPTIIDQIPGDFPSLTAWLADFSSDDLEGTATIRVAEVTGTLTDGGIAFQPSGGTWGPNGYPVVRAAAGQEYDPATETGAKIIITADDASVYVRGPYSQWYNFGVEHRHVGAGSLSFAPFEMIGSGAGSDGTVLESVHVSFGTGWTGSQGNNTGAVNIAGSNVIIRNCTIRVPDSVVGNIGLSPGFMVRTGSGQIIQNCSTFNLRGQGFRVLLANTGCTMQNCAAVGSRGADFQFENSGNTLTNNLSSDGSASSGGGTDHVLGDGTDYTYTGPTQIFTDPSNGDFTLAVGSPCEDAGIDLSAFFTRDAAGNVHNKDNSGWEIGAYDSGSQEDPVGTILTQAAASAAVTAIADLCDGGDIQWTGTPGDYGSPIVEIPLPGDAFATDATEVATLNGPVQATSGPGGTAVELMFRGTPAFDVFSVSVSDDAGVGEITGPTNVIAPGEDVILDSYTLTYPTGA